MVHNISSTQIVLKKRSLGKERMCMTAETNQTAARKTLGQLIRYGIVGGSSALLELVIFIF